MATHSKTGTRSRLHLEALEERVVLTAAVAAPLLDPSHVRALAPAPLQVQHLASGSVSLASVPNDPRFGEMWGLRNTGQEGGAAGADIKATSAWDVTRGSTKTIVSVMDTGIDYTHPDLYLNIWLNQGEIPPAIRARLTDTDGDGLITFRDLNDKRNQGAGKITDLDHDGRITGADILKPVSQGGWADGVSNDGDKYVDDLVGWNFADGTNDPMDTNSHGTHVAGTIGAIGNNGIGVTGINWNVQLMPVKFISNESASVSAYIEGLQYAVAHGSRISNNSWVSSGSSEGLKAAIEAARDKGHIVVAAAGNSGTNNDGDPNYPASYGMDNIVSVAALDRNGQLAGYSNYGVQSVDVAAPGGDILSTLPGGGYGTKSGTSMATPHVAGTLALVWSQHPEWSYQQVVSQVESTAVRTSALAGKIKFGLVNAAAAVGAVRTASTPPLVINAVNLGNSATSLSTVRLTFDRAMTPSTFTSADVSLLGPDGKAIYINGVVPVSGYGNRVYDISFANQARAGNYSLRVGPDVKDASGNQMTPFSRIFALVSAAPPPAIVNAVSLGSASSLSTVRVSFDRAVSSSSFTTGDVSLTGPDGKAVAATGVSVAAGYSANVYDISFAPQTRAGSYSLRIGTGITDASGKAMASAFSKTFTLVSAAPPPAIVNAVSLGSASSLSTVRVSFDRAVSSSSFTTGDVSLTGPDGKAVAATGVSVAAGYSANVYDISFAPQSRAGSYSLRIGTGITDASGKAMASAFSKTFTLVSAAPPPAIVNAVSLGSASSLSTVRVSFDRVVLASTFTAADVSLTGPDGKAVAATGVSVATGYSANVYDISFAPQSRAGNYSLRIGTGITDASGKAMASAFSKTFTLSQPPSASGSAPSMTAYVSTTDVNIVPRGRSVSMLQVSKSAPIGDLKVELNIQHPRVSDLYVTLQAPDGTTVVLINQAGGNAAGFLDTVLSDDASGQIGSNQNPVFGTFKPSSPLSALDGRNSAGTWKLWIQDRAGLRSGTLTEWSLLITPQG